MRYFFFFQSKGRHTIFDCDWSSDVCSSDLSAAHLPQRSEQRIGVARIENDVDPAAVAVAEQHPLPGLAAIPGAEDPALVVGPERVAERGEIGRASCRERV